MANLIITENSLMAIYVAASLGGIKHGKSTIRIEDIPGSTEALNNMVLSGTKSFETVADGEETHVTWLGDKPIYVDTPKSPPEVYRYISYRVSKDTLGRLTRKKYKDPKTGSIGTVYFAVLDTENNEITKELIQKTLKAGSFRNMHIREMSESGVKKAFAEAENYTAAGANRAKVLDAHRANVRKEIIDRIGSDMGLDHYSLCFMMLITRRETIRKAKKTRNLIQAKSHIHGIPCTFSGRTLHTKEEAENLIKEFPQTIIFDGRYDDGLLKTIDLFDADRIWTIDDLGAFLRMMFIKGYISNPITDSRFLPISFRTEDDDSLLAACRHWTKEETIERKTAKKSIGKLKRKEQTLGAIVPCGTEGKEHMPLSDTEAVIYDTIVRKTVSRIELNAEDSFRFYADDYPLYTKFYVNEIKSHLRSEEHLGAIFETVEEKNGKRFDYITLHEIMEELDHRGIGNADIYIQTYETLKKEDIIRINGGGGVTLTEKGTEIFTEVPVGKSFVELCSKWEKEIDEFPDTEWPKRAIEECKKRLNEDRMLWDKAKGIDRAKKEKEKSVNETHGGENLVCPACKKKTVSETDTAFLCSACGFEIQKTYESDGYVCSVSEEDIRHLAEKGKTTGKSFRKGEKTLSAFIIMTGSEIDVTNQSDVKCPYCGDPMYAYDWGFGCDNCDFNVPFIVGGVRLPMKEFVKLLRGKETSPVPGFRDAAGTPFSAVLSVEKKDGGYIVKAEKEE